MRTVHLLVYKNWCPAACGYEFDHRNPNDDAGTFMLRACTCEKCKETNFYKELKGVEDDKATDNNGEGVQQSNGSDS